MGILLASIAAMGSLFHELGHLFKKPKYRAVFIWMLLILLLGTVFYHFAEGWSWLDSLYFSVITLSTVGYGDFSPTTAISKIFTSVYIFLGISVFVSFASMLAKERVEIAQERHGDKA
jgi:voltage-gated potassium channel Kch